MIDRWILAQPNWLDSFSNAPLGSANLNTAPGWVEAGTSLSVDTNCAAFLDLSMVDEGEANLDLSSGTISFWFQANWTSTADSGSGTGDWASLLTVGQWTSNATASCWSLFIDPDGTNLMFLSQSNGESQIVLNAPIDFDAGDWHNVCIAYSDTNCCLYLEGQPVTNAGPVTNFVTDEDFANYGAFVGSESSNGVFQARGQFQDLETFNGPLSSNEVADNYAAIAAIILNAGGSLPGSGFGPDIDSPPDPGGGVSGGGGGSPDSFPSYSDTNFWLEGLPFGTNAYNTNTNAVTFILHATTNTASYQLQTKSSLTNTNWIPQQIFQGAAGTNFTVTTFVMSGQATLFFRAINYSQDTTDSGLPDWWKLQHGLDPNSLSSSSNGVSDAYADPAGDGWTDLQKFEDGMNPNTFYTPPAPTVTVAPLSGDNGVLVSWEPSQGDVTGYIVYRNGVAITTVSVSQTSYQDNAVSVSPYSMPTYYLVAEYSTPSGTQYSSASLPQTPQNQNMSVDTALIRGPKGQYYLVSPNIPNTITNLRIYAFASESEYPNLLFDIYSQPMTNFNSIAGATYLDFPTNQFTNGLAPVPQSFLPYYNANDLVCVPMGSNGTFGTFAYVSTGFYQDAPQSTGWLNSQTWQPFESEGISSDWFNYEFSSLYTQIGGIWGNVLPFLDGTTQLRQNLIFQLESADEDNALQFSVSDAGDTRPTVYPMVGNSDVFFLNDYAWANFHMRNGNNVALVNEFKPFEDNYFYRNFVLGSTSELNPNGSLASSVHYAGGSPVSPPPATSEGLPYYVQISNQVPHAFPDYAFAASGTTNPPSAILSTNSQSIFSTWPGYGNIGLSFVNTTNVTFAASQHNIFGLPYESVTEYFSDGHSQYTQTLMPGGTYYDLAAASNYPSYFYPEVEAPTLHTVGYYFGEDNRDYLPGDSGFTPMTGMAAPIIGTPGVPLLIGAWAEQSVNGSTNKPGFIEQYFDKALVVNSSGDLTTNQTGVLSEYGEFFPTDPGTVVITTKTNSDGTNGSLTVPVIGLYTDRNHDGVINTSFSGPDFCTPSHPFQFWVNDDNDSGDTGGDDIPGEPASVGVTPNGLSGVVNGTRDLVDFFPVFIDIDPLIEATNLDYIGLTYRLSQSDGALNFLYTSLDATNSDQYLTDTNTAISYESAPVTQITSNGVQLVTGFAGDSLRFGVILVEAWTNTSAPLVLDVLQGTNIIAEAQLPLNITGVEQMFRHKNLTTAVLGTIDGPPDRLTASDVPNEPDNNGTNFIFVHGYNVNPNQARGWESEIFKRMFWSGSHAKFYGVTWDGYDTQIEGAVTINLHTNEVHAFQTAAAFTTFLDGLSGPNFVAAHSLGNMLVLAALNDHQAHINTHFMIDGAVALEAIDGPTAVNTNMVPPDWLSYSNKTWASEFFNLFPTNDNRDHLTWSNRLANFNGANVYNFYSSGEEVLRNDPYAPDDLLGLAETAIVDNVWNGTPFASYLWCLSEKEKGRMSLDAILGSYHGGWGYNTNYGTLMFPPSPSVVAALTSSQLQTNPVFDNEVDIPLYQSGTNGSVFAGLNQVSILSDTIPAVSYCVGANAVPGAGIVAGNINMQTQCETGWPPALSSGAEPNFWYHSDMRIIAYTYTHTLADDMVALGNLK
jgi:hypothetical protein